MTRLRVCFRAIDLSEIKWCSKRFQSSIRCSGCADILDMGPQNSRPEFFHNFSLALAKERIGMRGVETLARRLAAALNPFPICTV